MNSRKERKRNIYLTEKRKSFYMNDFKNLLDCKLEFWEVDKDIKNFLIKMNENISIQTLYSKIRKRSNPDDNDLSYLKFCYLSPVELKIYRNIIPDLNIDYNINQESAFYYEFFPPQENCNYEVDSDKIGLRCVDDKYFFYINHIGLYLKSLNTDIHLDYWKDITEKLSELKP